LLVVVSGVRARRAAPAPDTPAAGGAATSEQAPAAV
jgi:hypothetical protein